MVITLKHDDTLNQPRDTEMKLLIYDTIAISVDTGTCTVSLLTPFGFSFLWFRTFFSLHIPEHPPPLLILSPSQLF